MISLKFTTTTEKIAQSNRNGSRGTIYGVKRKENLANKDIIYNKAQEKLDLFTVGSNYKGEWKDDKKHGFGTEAYPDGCSYSGQWYVSHIYIYRYILGSIRLTKSLYAS